MTSGFTLSKNTQQEEKRKGLNLSKTKSFEKISKKIFEKISKKILKAIFLAFKASLYSMLSFQG
jgi:hypothetical protein